LLINAGIDISITNKANETALHKGIYKIKKNWIQK
jgi:hypothetical protein